MEPVTERINEPTPNGGDYAIAYFQDIDGSPAEKTAALRVEIIEYKADGTPVGHSIMDLTGEEDDQPDPTEDGTANGAGE